MEDDDFANSAQETIDVIDALLRNKEFAQQIPQDKVQNILSNRDLYEQMLWVYRKKSGITKRRTANSSAALIVGTAMTMGAELGGGLTVSGLAGLGVGRLALVGVQALGICAIVVLLDDGPIEPGARQMKINLQRRTADLLRDMFELESLAATLEMSAVAIATLTDEELISQLIKVISGLLSATEVEKFLQELAKRFPGCAAHISAIREGYRTLFRLKANPSLAGLALPPRMKALVVELNASIKSLNSCMAALG